jgi:hypothetical protein
MFRIYTDILGTYHAGMCRGSMAMRRAFWLVGLASAAQWAIATDVLAQGAAQAEIVVPTFSIFTAGTTISVPDRGYASLAGDRRASDTRTEFGPGFERGFASRRSASDAGVRVWIHDFQEMEQALARGRTGDSSRPVDGFAARMFDYASMPNELKDSKESRQPPPDDRTAKSKSDGDASFKLSHAADLFKRGQEAEDRGKLKVAALYYKSVVSLGVTPSASTAKQRLAALESKLASR